ncbi:four-carbon acid sugar kinase family protein [Cupriavidus sp. CV2]|uniref:3-oxo-tetronate kinase n=1 Tax=Cupriavidus ulmosensis TaxID=3065913 RepID=UPI00296B4BEE|nr:3-oxo-tetronate kinase [Cupriavidus sp. CV2]MDW3685609.1 four-carbon acid sugar kinase family protein [Cupriavidus sp. CV2]
MTAQNPSPRALLGCIADDFTGATDLANTLVRNGMRTVQTIGVPAGGEALPGVEQADALVVALKSRTIPTADAIAQSLAALRWLQAQGCRQFFFKYCSTFDSTDAGNIGPVAEALLAALGSDFTIACPAFPENGRTIFRGHLFVGDVLLNESGMENHPLTPMHDANLVRVLQRQSQAKVGLLRYDAVARGSDAARQAIAALRGDGVKLAIADAVSDADLHALGEACADLPLLTGGSGLALGLPANFRRAGVLPQRADADRVAPVAGPAVVLAGSASKATNAQVAQWLVAKRPALRIDPLALAQGAPVVEEALALASSQAEPVLFYATTTPEEVKSVQAALGVARAGHLVEQALADIAGALKARGTRRFVVAGGETSGAVVQALGVQALRIGTQIAPGVPATVTLEARPLALALKSGNFGGVDFFDEALRQLGGEA